MTQITASMVKQLRDETGLGMMECKKALVESEGDFAKARDELRIKSGAKADKVAGRQAKEGRISFAKNGDVGALVEVNCETDFVARDSNFVEFSDSIAAALAASGGNIEHPLETVSLGDGETVEDMRSNMVMKLGENIHVSRAKTLIAAQGGIYSYIHNGNKIAAMCSANNIDDELAQGICMHIAAMRPRYLSKDDIPAAVLEQEKKIFVGQAEELGKPADKIEKIVEGKLNKFMSEITLNGQPYVKDTDKTVGEVLKSSKAVIYDFVLFVVGEGEAE